MYVFWVNQLLKLFKIQILTPVKKIKTVFTDVVLQMQSNESIYKPAVSFSPSLSSDYLSAKESWSRCLEPQNMVQWHLSLFSVLLVMGIIQMALCAVQVLNGLLGALCGDCCGCCGGVSICSGMRWDDSLQLSLSKRRIVKLVGGIQPKFLILYNF